MRGRELGRSDDGKTEQPSLMATSFSGPAAVAQVTAGDLPQQLTAGGRKSGGLELLYKKKTWFAKYMHDFCPQPTAGGQSCDHTYCHSI